MQQPHPDQQMQQQIQYTNPQYQQLQQPIMLCPVQYVYEQLVPDEQGQPNPAQPYQNQSYLLNVQNTPPWAQNRPSMIYMQQMTVPPYMQQVVQNPMYNYQYQPMIVQEQIRQIVPSYVNQNVMNPQNVQSVHQMMNQNQIMQTQNQQMIQNVQSQVMQSQNPQLMQNVQNQGIMNSNIIQNPIRFVEKRETPILASMLNVRKPLTQNELVSIMRPQYQNMRPQMIIVNPIAKHTCVHNTQKEPPPVFIEKPQDNDIQSIRSQVPEGLSVKSIKVSATALAKPNDNVIQNIAQVDDVQNRVNNKPKLFHRDPQTNYKRKIKELLELNNKDENEAFAKRMCPNKLDEQIFKTQVLIGTQPNTSEIQSNNSTLPIGTTTVFNLKPQAEEKKLRNTVFVQARGRVDDVRVNEIQNVNYTNISNTGTNIANIMINNKSIENLNSVVVNNINLDFNRTNNEHFNIALNNFYNENIMHWNNQSAETNVGSEIITTNIVNLEGVPMQVISTQNNKTQGNFDNQLISEQVVQNMKVAIKEKNISSKEVEVVKENNRQDDVESTTSSNNKVTTMDIKNGVQNEVELTQNVSTENSSTTIKQLKNEPKPRKSNKNKVAVTDMTINKATTSINNVPSPANIEASNNSNDKSEANLLKTLEDEFINTSETTDMSNNNMIVSSNNKSNNNVTKNDISSDDDNSKSDVTNVKMTDVAEEIEKKENKKLKKTSKLSKTDKIDKKNKNKSKVTKDKAKVDKKKIKTKVFEKEPVAVYVLTHVLDGHIIQESNVPFLVQQPSMTPTKEKPILNEKRVEINEQTEVYEDSIRVETEENTVKESIPVETKDNIGDLAKTKVDTVKASTPVKTEVNEASIQVETENNIETSLRVETDKNIEESIRIENDNNIEDSLRVETKVIEASIPVETEVSSNTNTENYTVDERNKPKYDKPDTSIADEDSPFKDLKKSVVGAWTISEVTSYLMKHANWRDTAMKLADQEIDGESLLLARRDQLLQIDICEEHAQEISEFVDQVQ